MSVVLDRLYNLHWVSRDVARAAQPYLGFYAPFLKAHGFRSVINLRGENADHPWWQAEKALASRLGIAHFDVRLSSRNLPSRVALAVFFDALERAPAPVLLKCSGGQDRSGLAAALYILREQGAAGLARAEKQFAFWPYLHRPKTYQSWLRHFPSYAAAEGGNDVASWARSSYDPEHFAAWLREQGLKDSFANIQTEDGQTEPKG
jgi:protein tyrosine phosphatase (PTP) superfamily phosphohydrolase (DUF442 family)